MHQIGFIGLGTMGLPIATHLVNRGFSLKLYARRKEVFETIAENLVKLGAIPCKTISEVCDGVDVLITNITGTDDVESVLLSSDDPAIKSLKKNSLVIDHSTIDPNRTQLIAKTLKDENINMVDAPVSGGSAAAKSGQLIVMLGGEDACCKRAEKIISTYAKTITIVGANGHGQIAKLCNQICQTITISGIAEGLLFAKSMGADPSIVLSAIKNGMGGSPMMDLLGPKMVATNYESVIEARLHAKDVSIAHSATKDRCRILPHLEIVNHHYRKLMEINLGNMDTSVIHKIIDETSSKHGKKSFG